MSSFKSSNRPASGDSFKSSPASDKRPNKSKPVDPPVASSSNAGKEGRPPRSNPNKKGQGNRSRPRKSKRMASISQSLADAHAQLKAERDFQYDLNLREREGEIPVCPGEGYVYYDSLEKWFPASDCPPYAPEEAEYRLVDGVYRDRFDRAKPEKRPNAAEDFARFDLHKSSLAEAGAPGSPLKLNGSWPRPEPSPSSSSASLPREPGPMARDEMGYAEGGGSGLFNYLEPPIEILETRDEGSPADPPAEADHSLPRGISPFADDVLIYRRRHSFAHVWWFYGFVLALMVTAQLLSPSLLAYVEQVAYPTARAEFMDLHEALSRARNITLGIYDVEKVPWLAPLPDGSTNWFPYDLTVRSAWVLSGFTLLNVIALITPVVATNVPPSIVGLARIYAGLFGSTINMAYLTFIFLGLNVYLGYNWYHLTGLRMTDYEIYMRETEHLRTRYAQQMSAFGDWLLSNEDLVCHLARGLWMVLEACVGLATFSNFVCQLDDTHDQLKVVFTHATKVNKKQDHRTGAARTSKLVKSATYYEVTVWEGLPLIASWLMLQPRRKHKLTVEGGLLKEGLSGKFDMPLLSDADCFARLNDLGKVGPMYNLAASWNHLDYLGDSIYLSWMILTYRRSRRSDILKDRAPVGAAK